MILIRHIRYIYRFTKTERIAKGWERNTRFYLYLNNEEKIILNKLIDEDSRRYLNKYRCVDKFDRLMSHLANDLDLEIVREEIKWEP